MICMTPENQRKKRRRALYLKRRRTAALQRAAVLVCMVLLICGIGFWIYKAVQKEEVPEFEVASTEAVLPDTLDSDAQETYLPTESVVLEPQEIPVQMLTAKGDCQYFYAELEVPVQSELSNPRILCNDQEIPGTWEISRQGEEQTGDKVKAVLWFTATEPDILKYENCQLILPSVTSAEGEQILSDHSFDVSGIDVKEINITPDQNIVEIGNNDYADVESIRVSELGMTIRYDYSNCSKGTSNFSPVKIVLTINGGELVDILYNTEAVDNQSSIAEGRGHYVHPIDFGTAGMLRFGPVMYGLNNSAGNW